MLPKKLLINCVDGPKIVHILHEDRCLDDLPNLAPASLNNTLQIPERLACLGFHTAFDEIAGLGIEAEASGNEHKGWAHDSLTIWPKRLRCIFG